MRGAAKGWVGGWVEHAHVALGPVHSRDHAMARYCEEPRSGRARG